MFEKAAKGVKIIIWKIIRKNKRYERIYCPSCPFAARWHFPNTLTSFEVGRDITLKAIDRATASADRLLFICAQRETEKDEITAADIYTVGTVARIKQVTQLPGGTLRVLAEGVYRARARSVQFESGYYYAVTDEIVSVHGDEVLEEAYFRTAREMVRDVLLADGKIGKDILAQLEACSDPDAYIDMTVAAMRVRLEVKQELLEEESVIERLKRFERCLNDELEIAKIEKKIASAVRQNIDRSQKDYFLREQLKAIHTELGDDGKEEDEYRAKILAKKLPGEIEAKCLKELDRLDKMQSASPEYTVITGYLDWILDLPWNEETTDTEKLSDCVQVLDADHYGLEKIKERITEYLAVLKLTGNMKAPILCFVALRASVKRVSRALSPARSAQIRAYEPGRRQGRSGGARTSAHLRRRDAGRHSLRHEKRRSVNSRVPRTKSTKFLRICAATPPARCSKCSTPSRIPPSATVISKCRTI